MWKRQAAGRTLTFHLAGINNQNFIMKDEETGSWWQQVTGEAIFGPLKGQHLKPVFLDELTFGTWKREEPNGRVLRPDEQIAARSDVNMLVNTGAKGKALAKVLGDRPVVLIRGHGDAVVGPSLQVAVFRAIYTEVNANLQLQATALGGPVTFLNKFEANKTQRMERTWVAWKRQALERNAARR